MSENSKIELLTTKQLSAIADAARILAVLLYAQHLVGCQFCESLSEELKEAIAILSEYPTP